MSLQAKTEIDTWRKNWKGNNITDFLVILKTVGEEHYAMWLPKMPGCSGLLQGKLANCKPHS